MEKALTISRRDAGPFRVMLTECNAEMDWLREIMKADDSRVARSQVRTYAIMAEMDAMRAEDERRWKKP